MNLIVTDIDVGDETLLEEASEEAGKIFLREMDALKRKVESAGRDSAVRALESSYDPERRQHRATDLLDHFLHRKERGSIVIYVTTADIYTGKLNFIFGLALPRRRAGLVSTNRLSSDDRPLLIDRLVKEIVHETGHILGLEHCPNPECVMHFSNTLAHTDRKNRELCPRCAKRLRAMHE
jgi:archaemetzincin